MLNKIAVTLTVFILLFGISCTVSAQDKKGAVKNNSSLPELVARAREGRSAANPEIVKMVRNAYAEAAAGEISSAGPNDITGTWICHIPQSDAGNPPFDALQTFHADGTFVETSSLLGTGTEGPAHGVYVRFLGGYILTFELYAFDPESGDAVGRVRVRNFIRMQGRDRFISYTAVDFIEPDGNEIPDIDGGIFTAERMRVRPL